MPDLFIINLKYKAPLALIDTHMKAHLKFLDLCYEKKIFLISGRKKPRTGGIIIARGLQLEQISALMQEDPFVKHNLAEITITEFSASQFLPALEPLLRNED